MQHLLQCCKNIKCSFIDNNLNTAKKYDIQTGMPLRPTLLRPAFRTPPPPNHSCGGVIRLLRIAGDIRKTDCYNRLESLTVTRYTKTPEAMHSNASGIFVYCKTCCDISRIAKTVQFGNSGIKERVYTGIISHCNLNTIF